MRDGIEQRAADLGGYPDLVVIYLGMRVYRLRGLLTVLRLRSEVLKSVRARPDGLLYHESFYFSLLPLHIGLRQYWRDFDSLERWTRSFPHAEWWNEFVRDGKGTGFWHETYLAGDRVEGIYDGMREPMGLLQFSPSVPVVGKRQFARGRLHLDG
jgi:fumigallin biosynthesis monooxygenase-like protein